MSNHNGIETRDTPIFILLSKMLSLFVGLIGCAVIIGWLLNLDFLKSVLPHFIPMKVNAALAFILISISLLLQEPSRDNNRYLLLIAKLLALIVFLIGFLTLIEHILNYNLYIDELILMQRGDFPSFHPPGRMAPVTAVVFMLAGIALILFGYQSTLIITQLCAFMIGIFGLFVITGFTYHARTDYSIVPYAYAALHAAINFVLIALALLFMQADKGIMRFITNDSDGGKLARWLLPIIFIVPVLLGYLSLLGEYHGLYDRESGVAFLVWSTIIILMLTILFAANWLMQSDRKRKEVEAALIESEDRWKFALESANQGVWDWHVPEKKIYFSRAWKTMLGYRDDEVKDEQYEFESRVHPDDMPKVWKVLNEHFEQKTGEYICEVRFRCKDGRYKWILDRGKVIARDADGSVLRVIGTHTDITELKERLEMQELSKVKLEFALKTGHFGSWDLNLETLTVQRSLLHDRIFGHEKILPEWTYEMFLNHIHPNDRETVNQKFKTAIATNTPLQFKCQIIRSNDIKLRWIWVIGKQFKINERNHMIGLVQDITDDVEIERKLQESLSYTRTLIESSLDPLVTIDKYGVITDVNNATEMMTGFSRDNLIGSDFSTYFTEADAAKKGYQEVLENGFVKDYPLVINHASGQARDVLYNAVAYRDADGKIAGVFASARDVTERKQAEAIVKKYAIELERSNKELQQFAYIISHDMQEPLRMISSYLQLLERRYKGKLDKDADDFITFAVDGAVRLQAMINDMLLFSRIDTRGKEFLNVSFNYVLECALKNLKMVIEEDNAVITSGHLPTVLADEGQMIQLFQNLLSNAIKFRTDKVPEIHISAEHRDKEWVFSVRDNGIGIDPANKDKLFVIFKRLVGNDYPGTGIGLAICKRIIERHRGQIWVESELGKGAIFYFSIPE